MANSSQRLLTHCLPGNPEFEDKARPLTAFAVFLRQVFIAEEITAKQLES